MSIKRIIWPATETPTDRNIRMHYPIEAADWIWLHEETVSEICLAVFSLDFILSEAAVFPLHLSADMRFEWHLDGEYVGMGPDRAELNHWSFHSYEVKLEAGAHRIEVLVSYHGMPDNRGDLEALRHPSAPAAQISWRPGFALMADAVPVVLTTGKAPWKVRKLGGISALPPTHQHQTHYFVAGAGYCIDGAAYFQNAPETEPVVVFKSLEKHQSGSGICRDGWFFHPTSLPEQLHKEVPLGRVRMALPENIAILSEDVQGPWAALTQGRAFDVGPNETWTVILDLEDYQCAYPELTVCDGFGTEITLEWAESCYEGQPVPGAPNKGNRDVITGKVFSGFGDCFLPDGGANRLFRSFWWRAGRYLQLKVKTDKQPLHIESLKLIETRYPLELTSTFSSSDAAYDEFLPIAARGIQMCAHETYMDCPYYEQMMYTGDTRLQVLTHFVMNGDGLLAKRALELFDWSRWRTGFIAERCPSSPYQLSCTFSMVWILMLRDYAWWQRDAAGVREHLHGMRCLLEAFRAHLGGDDLMRALPGWSFLDWLGDWPNGMPPAPKGEDPATVHLLFLVALTAAIEMEETYGEQHLAAYNRDLRTRYAIAVKKRFWSVEKNLFAENPDFGRFTRHAQIMAVLSEAFDDSTVQFCARGLTLPGLDEPTFFFSFYLVEALRTVGQELDMYKVLEQWKRFPALGFKTPPEKPEPTRSDCHAWSSHPLYHAHATLAGVRPSGPGFKTVRIAPTPGPLSHWKSRTPCPEGWITCSAQIGEKEAVFHVTLPGVLTGDFVWQGQTFRLQSGSQELRVKRYYV